MTIDNNNLQEATKRADSQFGAVTTTIATLMCISDNLAEINETLKDIKHTLRMMDRNMHGSDY